MTHQVFADVGDEVHAVAERQWRPQVQDVVDKAWPRATWKVDQRNGCSGADAHTPNSCGRARCRSREELWQSRHRTSGLASAGSGRAGTTHPLPNNISSSDVDVHPSTAPCHVLDQQGAHHSPMRGSILRSQHVAERHRKPRLGNHSSVSQATTIAYNHGTTTYRLVSLPALDSSRPLRPRSVICGHAARERRRFFARRSGTSVPADNVASKQEPSCVAINVAASMGGGASCSVSMASTAGKQASAARARASNRGRAIRARIVTTILRMFAARIARQAASRRSREGERRSNIPQKFGSVSSSMLLHNVCSRMCRARLCFNQETSGDCTVVECSAKRNSSGTVASSGDQSHHA